MKNSAAIASSYSDETLIAADADDYKSSRQTGRGKPAANHAKDSIVGTFDGEEEPWISDDQSPNALWTNGGNGAGLIKITDGLHRNAEYLCQQLDMVMIGASTDCDLVLADPQIARHHCLVVLGQDGYLVRALDASVEVLGKILNPGDQEKVAAGTMLNLADVSLELSSRVLEEPDTNGTISRQLKLYTSIFLVMLILVSGLLIWGGELYAKVTAGAVDEVKAVESLPAPSAGTPVIETKASDLAGQVGEILRLSGLRGKTAELGEGKVELVGIFPNKDKLERVIHSRAMQDIKGLQQVVVRNKLEEKVDEPKQTDDKEIARVITGHDPYVVTRDDARYYPGAELDVGTIIDEIKPEGVIVILASGEKRLLEPGAMLY
ncbi:hypothetical protein BTA51_05140 [Hahella sp. CCB-MM4]|uniref:SctD/MshK family protein n=1 Tax=Hahella sp. (strain CCB-MM4) TaxID=1926491 RepID=UPI000B9A9C01|nr:FHA domain-containing protein [Hahella sp. CCB-MM4]OZG74396.1 hypothetical protein BTA51_05140 [Hahella sp. CCB-MM4]